LDRIAKEWANAAKELGFIKGGEKVGIFTDQCEPSNTVLRKVLVPALKAVGTQEPKIAATNCSPEAQQSEVPGIVVQMKSAGITPRVMATSYVGVHNFLQTADGQAYKPKYFASDYDGLTSDLFTKNFSENQWDRVKGITVGYNGWK